MKLALLAGLGVLAVGLVIVALLPKPKPPSRTASQSVALPQPAPSVAPPAAPHPEAALPSPRALAPTAPKAEPAWQRYAVAAPPAGGRAMVAIVLDDVGVDRKGAERAIELKAPLTLSFMAYANDLSHLTAAAHAAGHELMLHVPMEPLDGHLDLGPNGLLTGLDPGELLRRLHWDLERFSGYVGVNNHMGSKFTSDPRGMAVVLGELQARGLLFLDSRTIATTVGESVAREMGVPTASRDIFLDNDSSAPAVDERLAELEKLAQKRGNVIAIGHPHKGTLDALSQWLPRLAEKHLVLVPLTAIVKARSGVSTERGITG